MSFSLSFQMIISGYYQTKILCEHNDDKGWKFVFFHALPVMGLFFFASGEAFWV